MQQFLIYFGATLFSALKTTVDNLTMICSFITFFNFLSFHSWLEYIFRAQFPLQYYGYLDWYPAIFA